MSGVPEAISLNAIQRELSETKSFPELEAKIRLAMKTQSCQSDLQEASDALLALNAIHSSWKGTGTRKRDTTESALFRMTILLYARATTTNARSGERGPIQIHDSLTEDQLTDHQAIVDVRNLAQAHVYPNETVAEEAWHRAEIFLVRYQAGWLPGAASNRVLIAPRMLATLNRQVPVALQLLTARSQQRLNEVAAALVKSKGDELNRLTGRHLVDLAAIFGSVAEAERAFAATAGGASSWVTKG